MQRLAIYYTPHPDSEMALSASVWLGRDVYGKKSSELVAIDGLSALRRLQLVSTPAHYGFHATIKPPFQLLEQKSVQSLKQRLLQFAGGWQSLVLPPLEVSFMHDFFCLRPIVPCPPLTNLAAEAIHFFDDFGIPPSEEELEKRREAGLSSRQESLLQTWGYPYVLEEFRFHLTLTGKVTNEGEKRLLERELQKRFHPGICGDVRVDGLCLFMEEDGAPMRLIETVSLG